MDKKHKLHCTEDKQNDVIIYDDKFIKSIRSMSKPSPELLEEIDKYSKEINTPKSSDNTRFSI